MDLVTFDAVFRYGAVTSLLVLAVLLVRDHRAVWPGRLGVASALCTAAYLFCSITDNFWVEVVLLPACIANSVVLWIFGLSLFEDRFKPGLAHWGILGFILVFGIWRVMPDVLSGTHEHSAFDNLHQLIVIGLAVHLGWVAWRGRADDLVEGRRRFRLYFISFLVLMMSVVSVYELTMEIQTAFVPIQALQSFAIWLVVVLLVLRAASLAPDAMFFPEARPTPSVGALVPSAAAQIARRDLTALNEWISKREGLFTSSLTINGLGEQVKIPEHRLRRLINQELNFRNFNDFLNQYRIEEAKVRLRDPELARLPILTIAMDLGYGSIGPFNRAFKDREGLTPSAYRLGTGDLEPIQTT
ncbi:MAG: helix-turn-helix transcriptional regulator [Rhodobiaceae bacterium]|nr:helix-turn-helix transcriptional regulator [Rhodobiaceae bacterium]